MTFQTLPTALTACLAAAGLFSAGSAWAQARGGNPVERLPTPRMPAPAASEGGQILTAPVPAQPAAAVAVTPASFEIEGVKALPFADVAALFQPLARQPATVAQLTNAARQCTALYQQRGYALSFCFVPQQDFAGAVVRVVAVEGHIATVTIEGDAGGAEPKLRDFAAQLQRERPLTRASFERYTQLMAQLPGLRVVANATPPVRTDGAGLLVLKVSRQPYKLSLGADLRSSQPRAVLSGALNDPFVSGGSLSASTLLGDFKEEKFGTVGYSQLIGNDGLTLKAELSAYEGDPDADLDISPAVRRHNSYRRAELSAAYPLRLSTRGSLYASGGIYAVNNADDYFSPGSGFQLTDEVRHHAVYLQGSYQRASDASAVSLTARLVQGIDAFGAQANVRTTAPGPAPANPARLDFTRIALDGSHRKTWGDGKSEGAWGTAASFGAQYSPHTLPSSERVSFGSTRFARGYAAGEAAGDSGWGWGLELNRTFALGNTWLAQLQPYLLLEKARVSSRIGTPLLSRLTSASLGVRLSDSRHCTLDVAASKPTGDASPDNPARKMRLNALLSYSFSE